MANTNISQLPVAIGITGAEYAPCDQDGTTKRFALGLLLGASASGTTQAANSFLAGPTSGSAAPPSFRSIVAADVPTATISSILDNIGGTQGNVLYRGASAWAALAPSTSGYVLSTQGPGANPQWIPNTAGSVTSVGLALPVSVFSVTNSPVTSTGTLTGSFVTQSANTAFMGPTTGAAATPAFRVNNVGVSRILQLEKAGTPVAAIDGTGIYTSTGALTTAAYLQGGATAAVASATTIAPCAGDICHITGTTSITDMSGYDTAPGRKVCLIFDGVLTFTDGNHLKLAGNLTTTADDVICVVSDGANWFETNRSVN